LGWHCSTNSLSSKKSHNTISETATQNNFVTNYECTKTTTLWSHFNFKSRVKQNAIELPMKSKVTFTFDIYKIYILFKDSSRCAQSQYGPRTNNKLTISELGFKQEIMFLKTYYFSPFVAHNSWFYLHGHKLKASFAVWDEHMEI